MTKDLFLIELRMALEVEGVEERIIADTLKEYSAMMDDALERGETLESFIQRMGNPQKVASELGRGRVKNRNRLVSIMPFLATIAFFLIGYFYNAWHPAWLVFLLIPVTSILTTRRGSWRALAFFVILTIVILMSTFGPAIAVPTWSLFLLLIPFEKSQKTKPFRTIAIIYTVVAVTLYHILYFYPFFQYLGSGANVDIAMMQTLPLLLLVPIGIYAFWNGAIQIRLDVRWDQPKDRQQFFMHLGFISTILALYLALGFQWGLWHPGWLVFLFIPVGYMVFYSKRIRIGSLSPFIATALFVLVGEYVALPNQTSSYALSWLFFLLIPILNILFSKKWEA